MRLVIVYARDPDQVGRAFELDPAAPEITVGRDPSSTIVLPGSGVSRRHARIERHGEAWLIRDTGSTTGLRLGDTPVQEATLRRGDRLWIGDTLVVVDHEAIIETEYQPTDTDGLTGLSSRRHVIARLAEPATILRFDVVELLHLNHVHGHLAIDQLLVELAARLRAESPEGSLVGRVGGDDFVVVLPAGSLDEARALGAAIRARVLARAFVVGDVFVRPDLTVGVASSRVEPSALLRAADADLDAHRVRRSGTHGELRWAASVWTRGAGRTIDVAAGAGAGVVAVADGMGGHATGWLGARVAVRALVRSGCYLGAADVIPDEWGWAGALQARTTGEWIYDACVDALGLLPLEPPAVCAAVDRVLTTVPPRARITGAMVGCTAVQLHGARVGGVHAGVGRARLLRANATQLEELVVPHYLHLIADRLGLASAGLPPNVICNGLGMLARGGGLDTFEVTLEPGDLVFLSSTELGFPDEELVARLRAPTPLRAIEHQLAELGAQPDPRDHPSDVAFALIVR